MNRLYLPNNFFISFSLFNASTGVRFVYIYAQNSRICSKTGSSFWKNSTAFHRSVFHSPLPIPGPSCSFPVVTNFTRTVHHLRWNSCHVHCHVNTKTVFAASGTSLRKTAPCFPTLLQTHENSDAEAYFPPSHSSHGNGSQTMSWHEQPDDRAGIPRSPNAPDSIVGRCTPDHFIQKSNYDRKVMENTRGFIHLHHESWFTWRNIIRCSTRVNILSTKPIVAAEAGTNCLSAPIMWSMLFCLNQNWLPTCSDR